jgi:3-isopropylmalate/(R)-2-methylmalate dehydratase small subunit
MKAFSSVTGVAIPFLEDDVNTDQIAPVAGGTRLNENYAETLFRNRRRFDNGDADPDFVFNKPQFRTGVMLVAGKNFGCGSSRESAVWVFQAIGISCIVARSFADIYRENCLQNGILPIVLGEADADRLDAAILAADGAAPFTVDLVARAISGPNGFHLSFEIPEADRTRLLEGLDDIGLTLKHRAEIEAFEARIAQAKPWSQVADASSL